MRKLSENTASFTIVIAVAHGNLNLSSKMVRMENFALEPGLHLVRDFRFGGFTASTSPFLLAKVLIYD